MTPSRRPRWIVGVCVLLVALALQVLGANPAVSQTAEVKVWLVKADPGLDPDAPVWSQIAPLEVPLSAQGMTYPQGTPSVPRLGVRAVMHERALYIRVSWQDLTRDDVAARTEQFSDAVALQFPATAASSVPSVCMGQADAGVNIWQWRADSERGVQAALADAFPRLAVEAMPAAVGPFYPARAAGNPYAVIDAGPVQNLVATGFGTLGPAAEQTVRGRGVYEGAGWAVVFRRPFSAPGPDQPSFGVGTQTDLALAVWNGSHGDRNGLKSVSSFVRLVLSGTSFTPLPPDSQGAPAVIWFLAVAPFALALLVGLALAVRQLRPRS